MSDTKRHGRLTQILDKDGQRIFALLLRLTLRHDVAADLLQDLVVRLSESDGFDRAADPTAYAWRTAINLATDWRRQKRVSETLITEPQSESKSPLDRLIESEEHARLLDRLTELSAAERECFVLRFIEQWSYEQIAQQMNRSAHQVRGLCHAAVRRLRAAMEVSSDA